MKTWNFGIVGAGMIAGFHAKSIADLPNGNLTAVCDNIPERAQKLADEWGCKAYTDMNDLMRDPEIDVVTIATPSGFHLEPAIAAAENGKHVLCEKPLEITLERIDAAIAAHAKAGTQLGGIFPSRFNDYMQPLRAAIAAGRFGEISFAAAFVPWWRTDEYYAGNWRGTWKLDGGGALMNQSIHTIDMLCDLLPPVETVQAFTATRAHDIETEDTAVAALRFANGALGCIYGATSSYPGQLRRFELTGSKGTAIVIEDSFSVWQFADETPADEEIRRRFLKTVSPGAAADPAAITHENHTRNFTAFLQALETGGDFEIDGAEARKAVALIRAIYQSSKEQRLVKLGESQ